MSYQDDKRLHQTLSFLGLRAQATAVGLLQLCRELGDAGVLNPEALERIKDAISRDIAVGCPPSARREDYERDVRGRLDRLFDGEEKISDARPLPADPVH
jgi:hypothetical protein